MPTYQYACTACDHAFEQVQSFSEDSLTVCPECQGRLRKVYNAVGVVFKGSGFYKTDSRNGTKGSSASESKGTESTGSESKGSESKGSDSAGGSSKESSSAPASSSSSSSGTTSSKASAAT